MKPQQVFRIECHQVKEASGRVGFLNGTSKRQFVRETEARKALEELRFKNPGADIKLHVTDTAWRQIDPEPEGKQSKLI